MATQQSTIDFLTDQMKDAGMIRSRKMFGEYAIYCDEKVVALVCDDQLYIKPSSGDAPFRAECTEAPPYSGAKMYWLVDEAQWNDSEWLSNAIRLTAAALPAPKPKSK